MNRCNGCEFQWKLGDDIIPSDNILDSITFEDVILAVKCNCPDITPDTVRKTYREILKDALEDASFIVERNLEEMIMAAKKMRNG